MLLLLLVWLMLRRFERESDLQSLLDPELGVWEDVQGDQNRYYGLAK